MSGTSLDGVDAVCCRFAPSFKLLSHRFLAMPDALGETLLRLQSPSPNEIHAAMQAGQALARWYASAVDDALQQANLCPKDIRAIGCHGQTIRHRPSDGYSLQLNQPALLAELCGIDVIADFRSRDIAAGGQGAPLVPAFHQSVFHSMHTNRVIMNIGGMANVTRLPGNKGAEGFDCGPGNVLMDAWVKQNSGQAYDEGGKWAASGQVIHTLLHTFMKHPYFVTAPPKSCGREEFNLRWLCAKLNGTEQPNDVQATLLEFTAQSAGDAVLNHCRDTTEVFVCGGGAKNTTLLHRLSQLLPNATVQTTEAIGLPVDTVEAAAFAWLAHAFTERQPGNLPKVTGAKGLRVLGALYPAA